MTGTVEGQTPPPPGRSVRLGDGRRLGYLELGGGDGIPVLWCHGGLSSRLDAIPAGPEARALGVRLIAPDRPGVGSSDRLPGRRLLDWPADATGLMDALEIDRFAVVGWSLGGVFAAACAHAVPDRVTGLGLVAACIPRDWGGMTAGLNAMDRLFLRGAESGGGAARLALAGMRLTAAHAPRSFTRAAGRGQSAAARAALADNGGTWFAAAVAEGLRDTRGVLDDYRIMDAPWGFDPSELAVPTRIWQGDEDRLVPPEWGSRLAAAIAGSDLTAIPGEGHFLPFAHFDEILRAAVAAPAGG